MSSSDLNSRSPTVSPPYSLLIRGKYTMTADILTRDGIKIKLKFGRCDKWKQPIQSSQRVYSSAHSGCGLSDIGIALLVVVFVGKRTFREAPSTIQAHPVTQSLPSQAEFRARNSQRVYPVSSGSPLESPGRPGGTQHCEAPLILRTLVLPYLSERCR